MTKAERTRQFIIEQSAPVFNTKGVAGTAMSDVMQVTKMAKGGLYGHFESKEKLSCAVVDYCLKTMSDSISSGLNRKKTAKEKLFYFIDHFASVDKPIIEGGCPMLNFGSEADDTNPAIKERVNKSIKDSQVLLSSILACGQANNEFKSDWQIEDFAVKMFAMLEGGMLMAKVADDNMAMKQISKMLKDEIEANSI